MAGSRPCGNALLASDTALLAADVLEERGLCDQATRARTRNAAAQDALDQILAAGLADRIGMRDDERAFIHIAVRAGGCPPGVRV